MLTFVYITNIVEISEKNFIMYGLSNKFVINLKYVGKTGRTIKIFKRTIAF